MTDTTLMTPTSVDIEREAPPESVIVAFWVENPENLLQIAEGVLGGEPATETGELHLTLALLGLTNEQRLSKRMLLAAIEDFAETHDVINGVVNGIGRFSGSERGSDAVYASYDSPALSAFRLELVEHLERVGFSVAQHHGYIPHITLGFVSSDYELASTSLDAGLVIGFDKVTVGWGQERWAFDLRPVEAVERIGADDDEMNEGDIEKDSPQEIVRMTDSTRTETTFRTKLKAIADDLAALMSAQPLVETAQVERAIGIGWLWEKAEKALWEWHDAKVLEWQSDGDEPYPAWYSFWDVIQDQGDQYALVLKDGDLYRMDVTLSADDRITLADPVRVIQQFQVARTQRSINRAADGHLYILARSCTALLNKDDEIDSRALFVSMEQRFSELLARHETDPDGNPLPRRNLYHDPAMTFGDVVMVSAEDNVLFTVTRVDKDALAEAIADGIARGGDSYGDSHEFRSFEPQLMVVRSADDEEIHIPVHVDGEFTGVATCRQVEACAYMTHASVSEVERMKKKTRELLVELVGEDAAAGAEAGVDETNRVINEASSRGDAIRRMAPGVGEVEDTSEEDSAEDEPEGDLGKESPDGGEPEGEEAVARMHPDDLADIVARVTAAVAKTVDAKVVEAATRTATEVSEKHSADVVEQVSDLVKQARSAAAKADAKQRVMAANGSELAEQVLEQLAPGATEVKRKTQTPSPEAESFPLSQLANKVSRAANERKNGA